MIEKRKEIAGKVRKNRRWHSWISISVIFFIVISSISGLLLAYKKNFEILQPPTQRGEKKNMSNCLSLEEITQISDSLLAFHTGNSDNKVDRIDVRPAKGMAKVIYKTGYWEVQLDIHSGKQLSIARRHSDWIENLHDGSIISDAFKLFSMSYLSIGLLILSFTGMWMYWGAKYLKRK